MFKTSLVEMDGSYRGFDFFVKFMSAGYRCGYVKIKEDHPLLCDDTLLKGIKCHGGITFSEYFKEFQDDFRAGHWIGFDCSHNCDARDFATAAEMFGDTDYPTSLKFFDSCNGGVIRDLSYVVKECKSIIDQLVILSKGVYRYES